MEDTVKGGDGSREQKRFCKGSRVEESFHHDRGENLARQ